MIYSMTGYGKETMSFGVKKITVELKSLNSKNLDLNVRISSCYREKELEVRKLLAKELVRGKVDFSIYVEDNGVGKASKIDKNLLVDYMGQLKDVAEVSDAELLKVVATFPDILTTERKELDEEEWTEIKNSISQAVQKLKSYREDEGKALYNDFIQRVENIRVLLAEVSQMDSERIEGVKVRLQKSIADLEVQVDENRFEQELIYYLEKLDITEEIIRLTNHLDYFIKELDSSVSNGKKMAFISQEMGREINTIGSKSNYAPMQKRVVQMKDELEKIKEQMLNVL